MSTNVAVVHARPGRPARLLLPAWIVAGVVLVVATALTTPVPAADPHRAGAAYPGELRQLLLLLAVDATLLLSLVRPWSYRHAWGRTLLALVVWTPWIMVPGAALATRGGPASIAHFAWVMLTWAALLGATVVSTVASRRRESIPAAGRRLAA